MSEHPTDPDPVFYTMSHHARRQTNILDDSPDIETTPFKHKYLIKRPVMKEQFSYSTSTGISLQNTRSSQTGLVSPPNHHKPSEGIDNPMVEKRRFELFIDLIWVGMIGNLAAHFSDQAFTTESTFNIGEAVGEFIILFLIAWRMWKNLDEFMNKYHTNDFVERIFVIWALMLAMLYGNNAPYVSIFSCLYCLWWIIKTVSGTRSRAWTSLCSCKLSKYPENGSKEGEADCCRLIKAHRRYKRPAEQHCDYHLLDLEVLVHGA